LTTLDPKLTETLKEKHNMLQDSQQNPSMLFCADNNENITVLVNGYFPVAKFNLKQLLSAAKQPI
jgi:acyl-homoserine lactone acylase PvdQ